jgi:hypothetical protein
MVLRVSEVAALKVGDIDSTRTLIWVERNGLRTTPLCCRKAWQLFAPSPETCQSGFGHYGREANARSSVSMRESGRAAFHRRSRSLAIRRMAGVDPQLTLPASVFRSTTLNAANPCEPKKCWASRLAAHQSNFVDAL